MVTVHTAGCWPHSCKRQEGQDLDVGLLPPRAGHFPMTQLQGLELEVIQAGGHQEHWVGVCSLGFEPRASRPASKALSVPSLELQTPSSTGGPTSMDQETQRSLYKVLAVGLAFPLEGTM